MSVELVMPSNCLILISLLLLLSVFPCIRVFSNESLHIRWPKYWSFSFSISPSNEYLGLISWRIDWVWSPCCPRDSQRVLSNPMVQKHQFFGTQLSLSEISHPYMTAGKTIALVKWTFVSKVMSLLFNMLSSLDIAFLPRSKHLLFSWLQWNHLQWFWSQSK